MSSSRRLISTLALSLAFACSAATAGAAVVTVGSPLSAFNSQYGASGTNTTAANVVLAEAGAHASSPVNGTITQWRVNTVTPGQFALRVLRPASSGQYTGVGRASQTVTSPGPHSFPASLAIQTGDLIGLDIPDGGAVAAENANGSTYLRWVPALAEGSPEGSDSSFGGEIGLSADIQSPEPQAPSAPPKKKCKKKKKHKRSAESAKKKCKKKKKR